MVSEHCCGIRSTRGSYGRPPPFVTTIALAGIGSAAHRLGVVLADNEIAVFVTQENGTTVTVEFKRSLGVLDVVRTQPHYLEALCRNSPNTIGHFP